MPETAEREWLSDAFERFMQYIRHEREFSDHTVNAYRADLYQLGDYVSTVESPTPLESLTEDHLVERFDPQYDVIVEYARERGIDPSLAGRVPDLSGDASPDRDAVSGDRGAAPGDDA